MIAPSVLCSIPKALDPADAARACSLRVTAGPCPDVLCRLCWVSSRSLQAGVCRFPQTLELRATPRRPVLWSASSRWPFLVPTVKVIKVMLLQRRSPLGVGDKDCSESHESRDWPCPTVTLSIFSPPAPRPWNLAPGRGAGCHSLWP